MDEIVQQLRDKTLFLFNAKREFIRAGFKAKVAPAALKELQTLQELAPKYNLNPN
jgi:hypothetical protein